MMGPWPRGGKGPMPPPPRMPSIMDGFLGMSGGITLTPGTRYSGSKPTACTDQASALRVPHKAPRKDRHITAESIGQDRNSLHQASSCR